MLRHLESQMTDGLKASAGIEGSDVLNDLMSQFSQVSSTMLRGRKEILEKADKMREEQKQTALLNATPIYPKAEAGAAADDKT